MVNLYGKLCCELSLLLNLAPMGCLVEGCGVSSAECLGV